MAEKSEKAKELVKLCDISLSYGKKQVLSHFSLELPPSGVTCLFGPSGCGKTSLVHVAAGLLTPQSGEVIGLEDKKLSAVFQEDRLLPWYTVLENVRLPAMEKPEEDALSLLEGLGLGEAAVQFPDQLSGGMRRRAAFARACFYGGDLLFLDEPFKGQDREMRARMLGLVRRFAEKSPVLLITHDTEEAALLSDWVLVLDGPPLKVKRELLWPEPYEARLQERGLFSSLCGELL